MIYLILFVVFCFGLMALIVISADERKDSIAKQVVLIRTGDLTCEQMEKRLKTAVLQVEEELYDQLLEKDCMTSGEIKQLKRVEFCKTYNTIECRVDALMDENFYGSAQKHEKGRGR